MFISRTNTVKFDTDDHAMAAQIAFEPIFDAIATGRFSEGMEESSMEWVASVDLTDCDSKLAIQHAEFDTLIHVYQTELKEWMSRRLRELQNDVARANETR